MAANTIDDHAIEFPPISTPSPSIPLHLSDFLSGDTVQVHGDTGELQFSVQFKKNQHNYGTPFTFPDTNIPEIDTFRDSERESSSSSYLTPNSTVNEIQETNAASDVSFSRGEIMTRLRSGVLSPDKYNSIGSYRVSMESLSSGKKNRVRKGSRGKGHNVFDYMLKRRCLPLRPCNSYAFFLTANWGVVKCSSFEEKSKKLSKKWCKLPREVKKEYECLALKDSARYKRQLELLRNDFEQDGCSGLLVNSK